MFQIKSLKTLNGAVQTVFSLESCSNIYISISSFLENFRLFQRRLKTHALKKVNKKIKQNNTLCFVTCIIKLSKTCQVFKVHWAILLADDP